MSLDTRAWVYQFLADLAVSNSARQNSKPKRTRRDCCSFHLLASVSVSSALKQPACKIDAVARTGVALSALIACAARRKSLNGSVHQAYSSLSMHSTRNSVPSRGHPMPRSVLLPFCTLHVLDPAPRVAFHVRARQRDAPKQTETLLSRLYVVCRSKWIVSLRSSSLCRWRRRRGKWIEQVETNLENT